MAMTKIYDTNNVGRKAVFWLTVSWTPVLHGGGNKQWPEIMVDVSPIIAHEQVCDRIQGVGTHSEFFL